MSLVDLICGALFIIVLLFPFIYMLIVKIKEDRRKTKEEYERLKEESLRDLKNKVYGPDITSKSKKPSIYREEYETVEHLMEMFTAKKEEAKTLIEVVFPSPQLTNSKFIDDIENIDNDFFKVYNSLSLFFTFYPMEDERSHNIIDNEKAKLIVLYNRLINIIAELSILVLNEDCDINPDDVRNSLKNDTNNISMFSKSKDIPSEKQIKEVLDEMNERTTGTLKVLKRDGFGWSSITKKCKHCAYFDRIDENNYICLHWHSHPIPDMDACSDFEFDHGD